jgi:hypothetical protein
MVAMGLPFAVAQADAPATANLMTIQIPSADQAVPAITTNVRCHILPIMKKPGQPGYGLPSSRPDCDQRPAKSNVPSGTDLDYNGGPVVTSSQVTFIYLNCPSNCLTDWGNPAGFLNDLYSSTFIHVMDQYMKPNVLTTSGRYTVNPTSLVLTGAQPHTLTDAQLQTIILNRVKAHFPSGGGGGYGNMYSIFLPPGQDLCFTGGPGADCYCPDDNCGTGNTWVFCAYHSSFDSTDAVGQPIHIVYQAQPYQAVSTGKGSCEVTTGPNGTLIDSTNNVYSHEIFETLSDPDPNSG